MPVLHWRVSRGRECAQDLHPPCKGLSTAAEGWVLEVSGDFWMVDGSHSVLTLNQLNLSALSISPQHHLAPGRGSLYKSPPWVTPAPGN